MRKMLLPILLMLLAFTVSGAQEEHRRRPKFTLTVTKIGGSGTVSCTACTGDCTSKTYNKGFVPSCTATPEGGSVFAGWSGACTGVSTCTPTMSQDMSVTATFSPSMPLLSVSTDSRYLEDSSGNIVYLVGQSSQDNQQDKGPSDPPPVTNFTNYLDWAESYGINLVRGWVFDTTHNTDNNHWTFPHPWSRTGPGTANDGKDRFDFNTFNQAYFDTVRSNIIAAGERGMYFSVMLFGGWSIEQYFADSPFQNGNNINGIDGDVDNDGKGEETRTCAQADCSDLPSGVKAIQLAYIHKLIDEVGDLENIIWEVCNECGNYSTIWHEWVMTEIRAYEATNPLQHVIWFSWQWSPSGNGPNSNLFNSTADIISPGAFTGDTAYGTNPPVSDGSKVVISDDDHIHANSAFGNPENEWLWESFLRGNYVNGPEFANEGNGWATYPPETAVHRTLKDISSYAARLQFLNQMTPQNGGTSPASTGYALYSDNATSAKYLVFQPTAGASIDVVVVSGTYNCEKIDVDTSTVTSCGSPTLSAGSQNFTAPSANEWSLYLERIASGGSPVLVAEDWEAVSCPTTPGDLGYGWAANWTTYDCSLEPEGPFGGGCNGCFWGYTTGVGGGNALYTSIRAQSAGQADPSLDFTNTQNPVYARVFIKYQDTIGFGADDGFRFDPGSRESKVFYITSGNSSHWRVHLALHTSSTNNPNYPYSAFWHVDLAQHDIRLRPGSGSCPSSGWPTEAFQICGNFLGGPEVVDDTWYCAEMYVDPGPVPAQANSGAIKVWIADCGANGTSCGTPSLIIDYTDVNVRSNSSQVLWDDPIDYIWLSHNFGGTCNYPSSCTHGNQKVIWDNIVVSTERIGCN